MMMKRRLVLALKLFLFIIILGLVTAYFGKAHASIISVWECGQITYTPPDNARDPIIKIKLEIAWSPAGVKDPTSFEVEHYSAAGKVYTRAEQYRDIRMWSAKKSDNWSGVSIRDPGLTMVGTFYGDNGKYFYAERFYRRGQLETAINSICRLVEDESH